MKKKSVKKPKSKFKSRLSLAKKIFKTVKWTVGHKDMFVKGKNIAKKISNKKNAKNAELL